MPVVIHGPRFNRRVTFDTSPLNDRSESALAANPLDALNMVGASKRFTDPATYAFSLAAYATFDGGLTWMESAPLALLPGWAGTSDPAVAWDDLGNVYLVALPFGPLPSMAIVGIAVYKSSDGGRTWSPPTLIHSSSGDDKQWAAGDTNPASPYHGNVYAAWDDIAGGSSLAFARTTDHGATWKGMRIGGVDQAAGAHVPGVADSFAPELSVAADGTVYIVWAGGTAIKFIKSTDGGDTFSAPAVVASPITGLPGQLPSGKFRVYTLPTGCTGTKDVVVFAWADYREGVSRIYYRRSNNGGKTWHGSASGDPLLTGAVASAADQHDFHPQLIATPQGEIGCAFYEFGPRGGGEFPSRLMDVVLAVSTNAGASFDNRVTVTDRPWDPTVAEVYAHGNPNITFIGDYFGLEATRRGFFPFWTDTRTGAQEIFTARVAVNPADLYLRDYGADVGDVTASANPNSWEAPDLVVRRQQDGATTFVNEDLLRDGVTDHWIYGRVHNRGPSDAVNVTLSVVVGNYPSLLGLPGAEFRYPQDWYAGDWATATLQAAHLNLGESAAMTVANGATKIVGPVRWPAALIPDHAAWHPCLLGEVRADNDDSAGGTNGGEVPADAADPTQYGAYFWGTNNVCQRNLSYATVTAGQIAHIEWPFVIGSAWSKARRVEVIIDKGEALARTPMSLRTAPIFERPQHGDRVGEIEFLDRARVLVRAASGDVGEMVAQPGTIWRAACGGPTEGPTWHGGKPEQGGWTLIERRASVRLPFAHAERRRATLSFEVPATLKPGTRARIHVLQRNDVRVVTGFVTLEITVR